MVKLLQLMFTLAFSKHFNYDEDLQFQQMGNPRRR
jgi:hypothetical protein